MERRQLEGKDRPLAQRVGDVPIYVGSGGALRHHRLCPHTWGAVAMRRPACHGGAGVRRGAAAGRSGGHRGRGQRGAIFRSAAHWAWTGAGLPHLHRSPVPPGGAGEHGHRVPGPWTYIGRRRGLAPGGAGAAAQAGLCTAAMAWMTGLCPSTTPAGAGQAGPGPGHRGDGLDPETIARCDCTVCIPMAHGVDSLNVAAASAVAFWQLRGR